MYQVFIPTHPDNGYVAEEHQDRTKLPVYTRRGRLHPHIESAKRVARKHMGKVVDVVTGQKVADYLPVQAQDDEPAPYRAPIGTRARVRAKS